MYLDLEAVQIKSPSLSTTLCKKEHPKLNRTYHYPYTNATYKVCPGKISISQIPGKKMILRWKIKILKTLNIDLLEEENSSRRSSQVEVVGEIRTERDERKKSVVMFNLASNNAETILEVAEEDEGLELLDLENKGGSRKVSGTSGGGSGSSRGRRASIFSAFSNFTMNHRPSCFSRLSEVSPTLSMLSFYDLNYRNIRNIFIGILTVLIMSVVIMYFFIIFVPNSYFAKFPGNDKFNHL